MTDQHWSVTYEGLSVVVIAADEEEAIEEARRSMAELIARADDEDFEVSTI